MKHIALLRGINVGGHRKILMTDLKELFMGLGFEGVITYIQSGNVIFTNPESKSIQQIQEVVQKQILVSYDFEVPVLVITEEELRQIAKENPYIGSEIKKLYFTFLSEIPESNTLGKDDFTPDKFQIIGKTVHVHYNEKISNSKLTNNLIEKKLKVTATTRNWKTVEKLITLCQ